MRKHGHQIFSIAQHHFADRDLARLLHHFTQQRVRLLRNRAIRSREVRRIVERARNLFAIDKADDIDRLGGLDLDLGDVVRFDNRITIGFVLVALGDLIVAHDLVALLAALVVADWTKIVAVQLVELNLLAGLDGVVDTNGDGNQQKTYVAFPNRSHKGNLSSTRDYATD